MYSYVKIMLFTPCTILLSPCLRATWVKWPVDGMFMASLHHTYRSRLTGLLCKRASKSFRYLLFSKRKRNKSELYSHIWYILMVLICGNDSNEMYRCWWYVQWVTRNDYELNHYLKQLIFFDIQIGNNPYLCHILWSHHLWSVELRTINTILFCPRNLILTLNFRALLSIHVWDHSLKYNERHPYCIFHMLLGSKSHFLKGKSAVTTEKPSAYYHKGFFVNTFHHAIAPHTFIYRGFTYRTYLYEYGNKLKCK